MSTTYIVHYRLDDVRGTPGRCRTDHRVTKGDTIYTGNGRATVRSCITDRATDNTMRANARALRSPA